MSVHALMKRNQHRKNGERSIHSLILDYTSYTSKIESYPRSHKAKYHCWKKIHHIGKCAKSKPRI